jgi:hypothetical protein
MPSVALDKAELARPRRHDRDTGQRAATRIRPRAQNAARTLVEAVKLMRRGQLAQPDARLHDVRPK